MPDGTGHRNTHRLRGQQATLVGEFHDQRPVRCGLQPFPAVEGGVVVADAGVIAADRDLQVVVIVIFQQDAFQIHIEVLRIHFSEDHLGQNAGSVVDPRSEQEIKVTDVEVPCGARYKTECSEFRRALIEDLIVDLPEAAPLNAMDAVQRGNQGRDRLGRDRFRPVLRRLGSNICGFGARGRRTRAHGFKRSYFFPQLAGLQLQGFHLLHQKRNRFRINRSRFTGGGVLGPQWAAQQQKCNHRASNL